jgi:hypothetical protein
MESTTRIINKTGLHSGGYESRRAHDFYPTPDNVTVALLDYLQLTPITIWECASGEGAMSRVLEKAGHTVLSSDVRTECYGESGLDFLMAEPKECDAIITNPPFQEAELFIRKAVQITGMVAVVLKSQYWHAQKRLRLFNETKPSLILPLTWRPDFDTTRGGAPTMEVYWTVWIKGWVNECIYQPLERPSTELMRQFK